jgi:predicted O-methyltransferase YrrM
MDAMLMNKLNDHAQNIYSQFGEDGMLEKIFELIGVESRLCIEFGAWDGFHLSNTANLWSNGWKGVLIEGNRKRYELLKQNVAEYGCTCIHAFVEREGGNSLEALLQNEGIEEEADLLSIDIDGNDYYILESLEKIRPRVVICEYNPTIPAELELRAEYGNYFGCSAKSLEMLAGEKGYALVAITQTNCIFVLEKYKELFSGYETRLHEIRNDSYVRYLITSYSGDYVLSEGNLPYKLSFPYSGKLIGQHGKVYFMCRIWRPLVSIFRGVKLAIRGMMR